MIVCLLYTVQQSMKMFVLLELKVSLLFSFFFFSLVNLLYYMCHAVCVYRESTLEKLHTEPVGRSSD
jgi:hypothetical protein